jgi:hypothetical protein
MMGRSSFHSAFCCDGVPPKSKRGQSLGNRDGRAAGPLTTHCRENAAIVSIAFCNYQPAKAGALRGDAELQTDTTCGRKLTHLNPLETRQAQRGLGIDVRRFGPHRQVAADQGHTKTLSAQYWQHP